MNFVSYSDMLQDSLALAAGLPRDTVGVLGVPRSGMLVASIVAQELDCLLGDASSFTGTFFRPGRRMNWSKDPRGPVVVIDDSLYAGAAMDQVKAQLRATPRLNGHFNFAVLYLAPGMENRVHYYGRIVELPRMFAWNWRHSDHLGDSLCDMDGVLCEDPPVYDDDGDEYVRALVNAKPLYTLRRPLKGIVTQRLERWRGVTQRWLEEHGVLYDKLLMAPFETAAKRREHGGINYKLDVYRKSDASLLIESDLIAAGIIAQELERPVLCPGAGVMFP